MLSREKRSAFLICPVRESDEETTKLIKRWIDSKKHRHDIYWPAIHTDQNDSHGMNICRANRLALTQADDLFIWFSPTSMGSHFDIGMALIAEETKHANEKSFLVVNRKEFSRAEPSVLRALVYYLDKRLRRKASCAEDGKIVDCALSLVEHTIAHDEYFIPSFSAQHPWDLVRLGMLFYEMQFSKKRIILLPGATTPTPKKSFQNVLLRLAEITAPSTAS